MRLHFLAAAALTAAVTVLPTAPGSAATDYGCVSKAEFAAVKPGMTAKRIQRLTKAKPYGGGGDESTYAQNYLGCGKLPDAQFEFKRSTNRLKSKTWL